MNSRERVLRAIRFERPDRIPISYVAVGAARLRHGDKLLKICRTYPNDFYDSDTMTVPERDSEHYRPDGSYYKRSTDEWGCVWEFRKEGISGEVKQSPLEDWAALDTYRIPPPPHAAPEASARLKADMARQKERYVGWGSAGQLFERMQYLRGVENLFMDIALDAEEVTVLADRLVEEYLAPAVSIAIEAGADIVGFGDDWGTQQALLIHPAAWRRIFKPRYRRLFEKVHEGGALVWMHSDGMIMEIVDELIEIGVDVLNPQIQTMDWKALRARTAGRLCLSPDLDRQHLLPFGTSEQVAEHVKAVHDTFASPEGGLIYYAPIGEDVPLDNVKTILRTFHELRH